MKAIAKDAGRALLVALVLVAAAIFLQGPGLRFIYFAF